MRVVFMGTPPIAVPALKAIVENSGQQKLSVVGVFTQPDRPVGRGLEIQKSAVKVFAESHKIPVFQPDKISSPEGWDALTSLSPEIIVVAAYAHLLPQRVLDLPRFGCVNIHFSLLPRWRGAAPVQWSIASGDKTTGVVTMKMARGLDAGDVYERREIPIEATDTTPSLSNKLADISAPLILSTLEGLKKGTLHATPQDPSLVTLARKLSKDDERLNPFEEDAQAIDRKIRAFTPWPGTSVTLSTGERVRIQRAVADLNHSNSDGISPGVIDSLSGRLYMGTRQGLLEILALQWNGKKEMTSEEFMNSLRAMKRRFPFELKK